MSKLAFPTVTLFCADCVDAARAVDVMERCRAVADFGAVRLLTSRETDYPYRVEIPPLNSLTAYSVFMVKRAHEFVDTPHMLVVQWDGFIINAGSWDPSWLGYDYIGPIWQHDHVINPGSVGSGGFSLRTKAIMKRVSDLTPAWDGSTEDAERVQPLLGAYEDGIVAIAYRKDLEQEGFRFAPPEAAALFAQGGNNDPAYYRERPFGFHRRWSNVNCETGFVSPPPFWNF